MDSFDTQQHCEETSPDARTQMEDIEDSRIFLGVVQQVNQENKYNHIREIRLLPRGVINAIDEATNIESRIVEDIRVGVIEPNVVLQMTIAQGMQASNVHTKSGKHLGTVVSTQANHWANAFTSRHDIDITKVRRRVEEKLRNSGPAAILSAAALLNVHVD